MACEIVVGAGVQSIAPQGELTIYTVKDIRNRLLEVMAVSDRVDIDLAGVTDVDSAGLQLLLLAKRQAGKEVRFTRHSAAVLRVVEMANVGPLLSDPPASGAGDLAQAAED